MYSATGRAWFLMDSKMGRKRGKMTGPLVPDPEKVYDLEFNRKTTELLIRYAEVTGQPFHICGDCQRPFVGVTKSKYSSYDSPLCIKCGCARYFAKRNARHIVGVGKWS